MGDDIDRSRWTEQDHQAEQLGRDLAEIATGGPAGPQPDPVMDRPSMWFVRQLLEGAFRHTILAAAGILIVVFLLIVAITQSGDSPAAVTTSTAAASVETTNGSGAVAAATTQTTAAETTVVTDPPAATFGAAQIDAVFSTPEEADQQTVVSDFRYQIADPRPGIAYLPLPADLVSGEVHVTLDFDAMTATGSFALTYKCDGVVYEGRPICKEAGDYVEASATGSFDAIPIIPPPMDTTPPDFWTLPAEDWYPRPADSWYGYGAVDVEIDVTGSLIGYAAAEHLSTTAVYTADVYLTRTGDTIEAGTYDMFITIGDNNTWIWDLFVRAPINQPLPDPTQ